MRIFDTLAVVVGVAAGRRTSVFTTTAAMAPTHADRFTNGAEPDRSAETTPSIRSAQAHAASLVKSAMGGKRTPRNAD